MTTGPMPAHSAMPAADAAFDDFQEVFHRFQTRIERKGRPPMAFGSAEWVQWSRFLIGLEQDCQRLVRLVHAAIEEATPR